MEWILRMKYNDQGYKGKGTKLNWYTCNHFWSSRCNGLWAHGSNLDDWPFSCFLWSQFFVCFTFVLFFQRQDVFEWNMGQPFSHYAFLSLKGFLLFCLRQDIMNGEWVKQMIYLCLLFSFLFSSFFFSSSHLMKWME